MLKHCIFVVVNNRTINKLTMSGANEQNRYGWMRGAQILFAMALLVSFFLPWVKWDDAAVSGYALPSGIFFTTSQSVGGPADPFPQFGFAMNIFWLVPLLSLLVMLFGLLKKHTNILTFVGGALALSMATIYILFSGTLLDLGVGKSLAAMLQPALYLQIVAAAGLILTSFPVSSFLPKILWLLAGALLAFGGYNIGAHYIMNETHVSTEKVTADFTVDATDLLKEFLNNDTLTNKKYLDKTLLVSGKASEVNLLPDSTSNIKFADSTGSYAIFSLDKNEWQQVQKMKAGDVVSVKGVCSGSIFSEILGTTAVSFKRSTLK